MPKNYSYTSPDDVLKVLPERRPEAHKGNYGRLLIIGGGSSYVGAPALVALAALRSGADLATVAAPTETARIINSFSPDLITIKLPGRDFGSPALPDLDEPIKCATAVVIGPGLGTSPETGKGVIGLTEKLAEDCPELPVMFDADGLKLIAARRELLRKKSWLVTPHAREFELLTGADLPTDTEGRAEQVRAAASSLGCTMLLKSYVDIIASPDGKCVLNRTGNPGMTVGGTGDVLAGIVGTFMAQGAKPFRAAAAGSFLCGRAGDLCLKEKGYEFISSDLIEKLPAALADVRGDRGG